VARETSALAVEAVLAHCIARDRNYFCNTSLAARADR